MNIEIRKENLPREKLISTEICEKETSEPQKEGESPKKLRCLNFRLWKIK